MENKLQEIKSVYSTDNVFTALNTEGKINIRNIYCTKGAFAALTHQGEVITWGDSTYGGYTVKLQDQLKNIKYIASTTSGFAALTDQDQIISWGISLRLPDATKKIMKYREDFMLQNFLNRQLHLPIINSKGWFTDPA